MFSWNAFHLKISYKLRVSFIQGNLFTKTTMLHLCKFGMIIHHCFWFDVSFGHCSISSVIASDLVRGYTGSHLIHYRYWFYWCNCLFKISYWVGLSWRTQLIWIVFLFFKKHWISCIFHVFIRISLNFQLEFYPAWRPYCIYANEEWSHMIDFYSNEFLHDENIYLE